MSFEQKLKRMKKKIHIVTTVAMAGLALAAVIKPVMAETPIATVSGIVFADKNGNGVQDKTEQGLEGVRVSDGESIVQTDSMGKYTLSVNTDRRVTDIVFVTVPSGYKVQTNEYQIPQFYKNLGQLQPKESRESNFALQPAPDSRQPNFEFAGIADVHVQAGTTNNRERFTGQLAQLNELTGSPAFITISGDITNGASDAEFMDFLASTATSKLPVYPAVGNHDFTGGANFAARIDRYRTHLGPEWYSYDYGNKHFIVLENNMGMREADQMTWLKADLKQTGEDKEIVVITHKPFNNPQTPDAAEAQKYIDLLGQYNTRLVLIGHTHVNDVATDTIESAAHVVTNSSSYTIDQTPNGFRVISFKGEKETHPYKMYGVEKSLVIVNPAPGSKVPNGNVQLLVNAYNTTSRVTEAHYRIDGGQWNSLSDSGEMTWSAQWVAGREKLGEHTIEVRVSDDGKHTWSESSTFTLVDAHEAVSPVMGASWPMFHGNAQHTGEALDALAPDLKLAWSHLTDGTILTSSPAVVDGSVFIGTRDENGSDQNSVLALDLKSGKQKWKFVSNAQIQSSPAVADGVVYASSIRGTLYALDAKKGGKLWEKTIGEKDVNRAWMYYSPTVADGVVYQAYSSKSGGEMMALDARTGETVWTAKLAGGWITESSPVVKDGKVYVGADGGYLIALDAKDGKELWRNRPAGGWMHSMPAVADGKIYMGYGGGLIVALNADTGAELWRYKSVVSGTSYIAGDTTGSSPAVVDGVVYMGFPNGKVEAFQADNGNKLWSAETNGGIISSAAVSGGTVYIGSNDGNLYALDKQNGQVQWKYKIGAWVASSPAISGNTLVVGAFDGNVYAFTSSDKK
ncbi:outer membrane protein assembly factor BamB family protein [Ferviditalea candida]|uniref:PQQ-binding-like beta-propeller repeat protein n=1 Tax=Ferviditalea candida TaxID=3108399 RepID=A0ABU5ZN29_9BACL|nr:PQQ-binding-like beta-propeller repeat protein [Paenibacillaceae bacterium T2]